ncbi:hypothetical protein DLAC_00627 [Tieghemostelium lacteum]|uniref:DUF2421 domain-containing protein n=1 Tax=Tieghemostelium lacteum TaxID=361077 RepID=A0A152AA83_TIELA|nr:hypothetical protein DLAC_00627 [Tieghemostelium lacteum]|eukprot:KYR03130.1 hypothetical protein DLAC_00627 [Tieghemostelium lacteum]
MVFIGLRLKTALIEALTVILSSILIFLPIKFRNFNALILVPVFVTIIACNLSSQSSMISGGIVVISTATSSLVIYAFLKIFQERIWVSFIVGFFFAFFLQCTVLRGGRWFNGLACKKILLDLVIVYYFSPYPDSEKETDILETFICSLFMLFSIVIVSIIFPVMATKLFHFNLMRTLRTSRDLFRAIGYSVESKLYKDPNQQTSSKIPKNHSFTFPLNDLTGHDDEDGEDDIKVQHTSIEQQLQQKNDMTTLEEKTNESQEKDIVSSSNTMKSSEKNIEKIVLPLSSLVTKKEVTFQLPLGGEKEPKSPNVSGDIKLKKLKKSKSVEILSKSIPIPTDKEIKELQFRLTDEVNRLTLVLKECKEERWNSTLVESYKAILNLVEMSLKHLMSLRISIESGFSQNASRELVSPMEPFLDSLIEEVYLQIGLMIDVLKGKLHLSETPTSSPNSANAVSGADNPKRKFSRKEQKTVIERNILESSFEETDELIVKLQEFYKQLVGEYQRSGLPGLHESEISRLHFFIFGIIEYARQQKVIYQLVLQIKARIRHESIRYQVIRYGLVYVLTALPIHWYKVTLFIISKFSKKSDVDKETPNLNQQQTVRNPDSEVPKKDHILKRIFKFIVNYIYVLCFKNGKWKFPLQIAIAYTSSVIVFWYINGETKGELVIKGVWTCATAILVMSPSVGASLLKGFNRVIGTMGGGGVGFLVSWLCSVIPKGGKEVVILAFTFVWITIISIIQQNPSFSYSGAVSGLTFVLVVYGQYLYGFDYWYALFRSFHITMGVVWVIIICLTVFPYFSFQYTRIKMVNTTIQMSRTFVNIIRLGLKIETLNQSQEIMMDIDYTDRDRRAKEIRKSLTDQRMILDQIKLSLNDIKSELILMPNKSNAYRKVYKDLSYSYTRLVAAEASFRSSFSDPLLQAMSPINQKIQGIFNELDALAKDLNIFTTLTISKSQRSQLTVDHEKQLTDSVKALGDSFQEVRVDLLKRRILSTLHPEMIQFGSGMY